MTGKGTTEVGFVNPNGQVTIRDARLPGTDKFQRVYQLACSKCGHNYGANGADIHDRRCPSCGGGKPGLQYA
jgi:PHP family Zn ribbon phosphoesterase